MNPVHETEFAKLYEESARAITLKEGEIVKGKVVGITRDFVIVDIGFKSEGQISLHEFQTPRGELTTKVGDEVEVLLEEVEDENGMLVLSRERAGAFRTWDKLEEIAEKEGVVEGTVVSKVKGGLSVDIGVRAFLPGSQVDLRPVRSLDKFVGQTMTFKIIKLNKRRGNVVLSRKSILETEREKQRVETLAHLQEGQVFNGVVKNVTDYGLFVDLGGIDGLLHVTDMAWGRVNHPSELYNVGDNVRVVILKFDRDAQKVSLGLKQLMPDPWADVEEKFAVGSRVHGKVTSLTDYGAFIGLSDGVEGLVHISEMSWSKKVKHPSKLLQVGQEVDAVVLDIDADAKRISLGLKQILPNPWESLEKKFPLGSKVKATVRNVADFGVFVDVGADVDGMIHISDLAWVQNFGHPSELYKKDDTLEAVVLHIDPENERFALGLKQLLDDPWEKISASYKEGTKTSGKVVSLNSAGAVVEMTGGVFGLIPKEKLSAELKEGQNVELVVLTASVDERQFWLAPQKGK